MAVARPSGRAQISPCLRAGYCLLASAPPLRPLRLCGELILKFRHSQPQFTAKFARFATIRQSTHLKPRIVCD